MKSCAFEVVPAGDKDIMVFLHTAEAPTVEAWHNAMETMKESERRHGGSVEQLCFFVVTDGGAPDPNMRHEFNQFLNGRKLRVAVLTDHVMARGVVTAISWFNSEIKAFSPKQASSAFAHIQIKRDQLVAVLARLRVMQVDTGPISTLSALLTSQLTAQA